MIFRIAFIISGIFLMSGCGDAQPLDKNELVGIWYHSVEEQRDKVMVFRPEGYDLPVVRGREKMVFSEDNEYIYYQIAPSDGFLELEGNYKLDEKSNELVVKYQKYEKTYVRKYKIIELSQVILRMEMIE